MTVVHTFDKDIDRGKAGEWVMDRYHEPWYAITQPDLKTEIEHGFDRWYTRRDSGRKFKIEIKTEFAAAKTGNLFIETESNNVTKKDGWAVYTRADYVIIYIWDWGDVLYFRASDLRGALLSWRRIYKTAIAQNDGYHSTGVLVPIDVAENVMASKRSGIDPYWMKEHYKTWLTATIGSNYTTT